MTHTFTSRIRFLRTAVAAWVLLACALLATPALAQDRDIAFQVEIFRVDLVRDDDGEITERFVEVSEAVPGEEVEYRITAVNEGDRIFRPGTVVVSLPIGEGVAYVEGSAGPNDDRLVIEFSADGGETFSEPAVLTADPAEYDAIRWTFTFPFEPDQEQTLFYRAEVL